MSAATPPTKPSAQPANSPPLAPPGEEFWEKYSPHFEFPISTVATIAIHLVVLAIIAWIILNQVSKTDETPPVPISVVVVKPTGAGGNGGDEGSSGGAQNTEASEEPVREPRRPIPEAELTKEMIRASAWLVDVDPQALKTVVESVAYPKLNDLNDELKRRLARGYAKRGNGGNDTGTGAGSKGSGAGSPGDATSSDNRANRYIILFRTNNAKDYVNQLAAFEAKIVFPEPPAWKKNRLFEDISMPNPGKLLSETDELPAMRFVDNDKGSAARVARVLGLDYDPPYFIAFFPKRVEDELAAKERAYRKQPEERIKETTFRVLERDGKYEIKVTDQVLNTK